ncbi:hypothetical protein N3K66_001173 [Trichothecium roseum]|uniref:Uncharacterized protein n=1 Tax=Trichothecium roseum TaxID=47278 RepID=A0ACC0VE05_9HYPO|nr:hypothetical protein N3K66_001173 [Trichothecium roseum]
METLQLSQVLADLSSLGAAEPEAAAAIVSANSAPVIKEPVQNTSNPAPQQQARPSALSRAWSYEAGSQPMVDKFGRRLMVHTPGSRPGSVAASTPGTPRRGESDVDDDLERASTLMALYDIRSRLKHQNDSSLNRAREKINALAAKQQALNANTKQADELRRNRYSFPKPGL